ncbi:Multi-sensor signal transduction histidine kinase [uncultured delta proteobacterium]|uniref:histidine kinase n=1 Tax=uncultured delta proteobacterium TaxID=34034 RepID=A0A212KFH3_9DELT|nr:Multi-sensor signal transduction histidine kinase [uncultured delta proteobacterium]
MIAFLKSLFIIPTEGITTRERERLRRRRELISVSGALVLALVLTRVLFYLYDTGSALFITVFSLNFLLLLAIFVVVIRNTLKLLLERRRGVIGARLRTRMTLAFVIMTVTPCLLMFLITSKFVQISVDFWFKDQISGSMETALEVGRADLEKTERRILIQGMNIIAEASDKGILHPSPELDAYLRAERRENALPLIGILSDERRETLWHASPDAMESWRAGKAMFNWDTLEQQGSQTILSPGLEDDYVLSVQRLPAGGFFVSAQSMGPFFKTKMDRLAAASTEYKQLRQIRNEVKWMLYSGLSVLTMLIMLGAIWFGFRVAKEVTAPVLSLADAAQRIAKGELDVRLDGHAKDEIGMLIRAFNSMAADLETFRADLTGANNRLEEQNREIVQHSQYVEAILNNITSGVISVDHEGHINMVNTAACAILGSSKDVVGQDLVRFLPEEMGRQARAMFEQFRNRPLSTWQRQINMQLFGQERRLMVSAAGLVTPEGENRGFVAVFEDISEMERMQRMAAWREVARRIAHEIKNPLTPIKLSAQRLQRKFGNVVNDAAFSQSTELIVRQVENLQDMVQEFSAFAKLPEVDPKAGDITPLLTELAELFRNSHSQIQWVLDLPDSIPILPMDKNGLRRAFLNILANAAEAVEQTPAPQVRIGAAVDTARSVLRIAVEDNGQGLSENERSRLFEPYFSRKKGGTGLGLTIVRSIVSDHKGYVRADTSTLLGGAMITIELPLM